MEQRYSRLNEFFIKNKFFLILLLLLTCSLLFRAGFEIPKHPVPYYFDQLNIDTQSKTWYYFLLPSAAKLWGGTWSSLGIGLLPLLNQYIGITFTYVLLSLLFVSVAYILSWYAFRSTILTITVGICTAFTTLNSHVYNNGSLVIIYIPFIFCFLNLFALCKLFSYQSPKNYWWWLWAVSLFLYITSFEGWVDYFAINIILSPVCFYILKKIDDPVRLSRYIKILSVLTVSFLTFVFFKVKYGYASNTGDEHDLFLNYGLQYWPLMIDDVISNFFTFFYMTIITYLPPQITISNAFLLYGPATIVSLQNSYDGNNVYLAAINALLLWRFYAGIFLSIFLYYFWKVVKQLFTAVNKESFFLFIFMMMVLFGAPAHFLIKFRPMHVLPWLPYQGFIGQIGLILLIGYALHLLHQSAKNKSSIWTITVFIWAIIIISGFLKDPLYKAGHDYAMFAQNCNLAPISGQN